MNPSNMDVKQGREEDTQVSLKVEQCAEEKTDELRVISMDTSTEHLQIAEEALHDDTSYDMLLQLQQEIDKMATSGMALWATLCIIGLVVGINEIYSAFFNLLLRSSMYNYKNLSIEHN